MASVTSIAVVLSWPSLYNGYPYFFTGDSYAYLTESLTGNPIWGRPSFYSYFTAVHFRSSVWLVEIVQAVFLALAMYLFLRHVTGLGRVATAVVGSSIGGLTAAAWYVGLVTPDTFTAVLILTALTWGFAWARLPASHRWVVGTLFAIALPMHGAHLLLGAGLIVVLSVLRMWWDGSEIGAWQHLLPVLGGYVAIVLVMTMQNGIFTGAFGPFAPHGGTIMFAWLYEEGLAGPALDKACRNGQAPTLCSVATEPFPTAADPILFGPTSPLKRDGHHPRDFNDDTGEIVVDVLLNEPLRYALAGVRNTWEQLWDKSDLTTTETFLRPIRNDTTLERIFDQIGGRGGYVGSRQFEGSLQLGFLEMTNRWLWRLGAVAAAAVAATALYRRKRELAALAGAALLAVLGHAASIGFFAPAYERYGPRAAWVPALVVTACLASWLSSRRRRIDEADKHTTNTGLEP